MSELNSQIKPNHFYINIFKHKNKLVQLILPFFI